LLSLAQEFSGLPMQSLIAAPLQAAAQAQQSLAMQQTLYLLNTGFSRSEDANGKLLGYKPITAAIALTNTHPVVDANGNISPVTSSLALGFPLLSMMPIPTLAVTELNISFDMEVKSSYLHDTQNDTHTQTAEQGTFDAKVGWGCLGVEVKGSVSHDADQTQNDEQRYRKSNNARYHLEVKAEQQPIPDGIKLLLGIFSRNIDMAMQPISAPGKQG
jgi:hypothetical protein